MKVIRLYSKKKNVIEGKFRALFYLRGGDPSGYKTWHRTILLFPFLNGSLNIFTGDIIRSTSGMLGSNVSLSCSNTIGQSKIKNTSYM